MARFLQDEQQLLPVRSEGTLLRDHADRDTGRVLDPVGGDVRDAPAAGHVLEAGEAGEDDVHRIQDAG
jgi:hypothetical protein